MGKAKNSLKRLKKHIEERNLNRPVCKWVKSLVDAGMAPRVVVLETVPDAEWEDAERRLIAKHRETSKLLNLADGGAMPSQTKTQRKKAARAAYNAIKSNPAMLEVHKARMEMSKLLARFMKRGYFSHAYRLKFRMKCYAADKPDLYGCWASL